MESGGGPGAARVVKAARVGARGVMPTTIVPQEGKGRRIGRGSGSASGRGQSRGTGGRRNRVFWCRHDRPLRNDPTRYGGASPRARARARRGAREAVRVADRARSEEHTSELQSQ